MVQGFPLSLVLTSTPKRQTFYGQPVVDGARLDVVGVGRISTLDVNGKPLDGDATRASMRMKVRDYLIRCTRSHARMSLYPREFS